MEVFLIFSFFIVMWLFGQPSNVAVNETIRRVCLLIGGWMLVVAPIFFPVYLTLRSGFLWPYKMGAGSAAALGIGLLLLRYNSGRRRSTYFLILVSSIIIALVIWNYASILSYVLS